MAIERIAPRELARRIAVGEPFVLLDVREPAECSVCQLAGSINIPLGELGRRHGELDRSARIVCICHHGVRSSHAASALQRLGFEFLLNLAGGIDRWATDVDPQMSRY